MEEIFNWYFFKPETIDCSSIIIMNCLKINDVAIKVGHNFRK